MRVAAFLYLRFPSELTITLLAAAVATGLAPAVAPAQGTHLWTQSRMEEFEKGTPQGVAITSDGRLREAPGLTELATTPSTFVWSVTVDAKGTAYVGTGSPASVLRVGPDGKTFTLFETHDLTVQALRIGPDGALYAATIPSGKVFRLKPGSTEKQDEGSAELVFDAGSATLGRGTEKPAAKATETTPDTRPDDKADGKDSSKPESKTNYVWDLTFDKTGRLYVATGGPGAIYRVQPGKSAAPEEFFKSDEQHIRTLAWDAKGNLLAGSDGSGLIYRVNAQGKGYVVFDAPRREITSLAVSADGTIYAASVGDKSRNPLPPLPVQGAGAVTFTVVQPGSLQVANSSTSAPEGTEIYQLKENQAPRKLWSGKDEVVYALAVRPDGLLALSGNRGRIFKISEDGTFADIGHLEAQQGLSLAVARGAEGIDEIFIGTGNTGKLCMLGRQPKHEYSSDVLDAGALARFGRVEIQPGSAGFDILTRSGNVEQPVRGWSDWDAVHNGEVASPAGRFLQWKAVLHPGGNLGGVGVNYLPVNAAPIVDDLVVVPGARLNPTAQSTSQPTVNISFPSVQSSVMILDSPSNSSISAVKDKTAITARWAAHDDNGDDLTFSIYLRGDGEQVWRLLKENVTDHAYSFDATLLPDGGYEVKVVASDAPSHSPGDALTASKESDRFEVDTTPPAITGLKAVEEKAACTQAPCARPVVFSFDAEDAMWPIVRAEYSLDAGPWQYIDPVGGLSDSPREHYEVHFPASAFEGKPGEHLLTVRAYDRHDNVGLAKTVFGAPAPAVAK